MLPANDRDGRFERFCTLLLNHTKAQIVTAVAKQQAYVAEQEAKKKK
jgi:hypothetical protein